MIYLDSAATTYQKPPAVFRAVRGAMASMTSPGRGTYGPAARASRTLLACREEAAALFQVGQPERVVLTFNATHGLNIAVHSLVKPGATVLLSGYEHNAVTRPLASIADVRLRVVRAPLFCPNLFLEELERRLTPEVDVVICTHVSNVFGYVLPVEEVAALCRRRQVPLIVDASQSAGVLPVRMEDWGAAFVAMPGHKGLYGPQGTGLLLCQAGGEPLIAGGTGSLSRQPEMPDFLPDRLEAGTHNVPGVAGLLEGLRFLRRRGIHSLFCHEAALVRQAAEGVAGLLEGLRFLRRRGIHSLFCHEAALVRQAAEGLAQLPRVQVYSAGEKGCQSGVLSFRVAGRDPGWVAEELGQRGIAVRAGLHCAPLAHATGGTEATGTVRVSFSAFNTGQEVERFLKTMRRLG